MIDTTCGQHRPPAFIGRSPRVYDAVIAREVGAAAAAWLQQIIYCLHRYGEYIDGQWWVRLSFSVLLEGLMHKDSASTLKRALAKLKRMGLVETCQDLNEHGYDRTTWYAVNESRIYEVFWPELSNPPEPEPEPPPQQVNLTEAADAPPPSPEPLPQQVNLNSPSGHETKMTSCPEPEPEQLGQPVNLNRGSFWPPSLRFKKERLRSRSDTECRTGKQSASDSSSQQTPSGNDDIPPPEASDFFVSMDLGEDEEPANAPLFVHFEPDEPDVPMAAPEPAAAPVAAAPCLHPDESVRMIWGKPGLSFYCRRCRKTIIDGKAKKPPPRCRDAPKPEERIPRPQCHRLFVPDPRPELAPEEFLHACPKHGRFYIVLDNQHVELCQRCGWQPKPGMSLPPEWTREAAQRGRSPWQI